MQGGYSKWMMMSACLLDVVEDYCVFRGYQYCRRDGKGELYFGYVLSLLCLTSIANLNLLLLSARAGRRPLVRGGPVPPRTPPCARRGTRVPHKPPRMPNLRLKNMLRHGVRARWA